MNGCPFYFIGNLICFLLFQEDDSIDKGTHILKLLTDIERKETGGNP